MRTTVRKSLLVAFMFGTLISYANENTNPAKVKAVRGKRVKIEFRAVKKGQTFTIKNNGGISIYRKNIKNSGDFSKIFDLSALENGVYTAEVNKDFEIITKTFSIQKGLVTFLNEEKIFKPSVRNEGDLLLVSKINFNKAPLTIAIYYEGRVIFSESVTNTKEIVNRTYKLSTTERGDYRVVLNSENRTYTEDFII